MNYFWVWMEKTPRSKQMTQNAVLGAVARNRTMGLPLLVHSMPSCRFLEKIRNTFLEAHLRELNFLKLLILKNFKAHLCIIFLMLSSC